MPNLIEHLKEAENSVKKGFKKGLWSPHKSFEGGTDTLAYGHKLSKEEHSGGFVELPDGTIHDFDDGGITEDQAFDLLVADINRRKNVAKLQWNKANKDQDFDSLSPVYQDLLTEIAFNVAGGLNNRAGNFGWKRLAKAIKADDIENIKKESERKSGNQKLTTRNQQVADFIDNWEPTSVQATEGDVESEVVKSIQSQLAEQNVAQTAPESISEGTTEVAQYNEQEERVIQDMMNELQGLPTATEVEYNEQEERVIEQMMLDIQHNGLAAKEPEPELDEFDLINRIYG